MEELSWKKSQITKEFFDQDSVGDLILHLEKIYWKQNKVICGVFVNNKYIEESEEDLLKSTNLDSVECLKILVSSVSGLVQENINTIVQRIEELEVVLHDLLSYRKRGEYQESEKLMVELVSFMHSLIENINVLKAALINNGFLLHESETNMQWEKLENLLTPTIMELLDAYEAKDHVLLNDILEYDLLDIIISWKRLLVEAFIK
ncbi:MAG: hypothetical protein KDD50_13160 [Bdellovibrionales bacterium]|nr:hypothetical protein [Bdellovibrionales bacterium]